MRRSGARRTAGGTSKRSSKATVADAPSLPPPPVTPPPLVPARVYSVPQDQPPQSPPPLTQAAHTSSGFVDRPQPRTEHESPILPRYSPHIEPPLSRISPMPEHSAYVPRRDSVLDSREDEVGYSGFEETPILSRRHHTQPQQQYLPSLNTELGGYDDHDYSPSSSRYSAASYPHSSPTTADYDRYPRDSSQASSSGSSHSSPSHSHLNSPQMPTNVTMAYPSSSANISYGSHVGSKTAMSTQPFEAALASYASHSHSASVTSQQFGYQAPSRYPSPPQMTAHEDVYQRRPSYITTSYVHHPQPIAYHYDYDYTANGQQQWKSDVGVRHRNSIGTLVQ
jgi:zinc-finger protein CreA/MIG